MKLTINQVQSAWYEPSPDCIWICTFHRHCKKGLGTKKFALSSYWSTHQGRKYDTYKYSINCGGYINSQYTYLLRLSAYYIILGSDTQYMSWPCSRTALSRSFKSLVSISQKLFFSRIFPQITDHCFDLSNAGGIILQLAR